MGGEFLLKIWVNALKDFHYDVEDLLDEYSIETPQCRWSTECQESTAEVRKLVSCCYIELDPSLVMFRSRLQKLVLLMAETVVVLKANDVYELDLLQERVEEIVRMKSFIVLAYWHYKAWNSPMQGLSSPLLPYYLDIIGYLMMTRGLLASSLNFWLSIQGFFAPEMCL
ncbi:Uncharacterized protein TCM_005834 [Theobroma cacao]|uniref:Disease resistance N-terminal domain-containing protein n=1 Tax=Theobroma cacao TaxID=3641 RepID=A0A061DW38_THECC|nr:Uncharacterized protein TCM_005834 [Theobroma cacao]